MYKRTANLYKTGTIFYKKTAKLDNNAAKLCKIGAKLANNVGELAKKAAFVLLRSGPKSAGSVRRRSVSGYSGDPAWKIRELKRLPVRAAVETQRSKISTFTDRPATPLRPFQHCLCTGFRGSFPASAKGRQRHLREAFRANTFHAPFRS